MTLPFGTNLFPPRRELLTNFDFSDVIQNNSYSIYFLGTAFDNAAADKKIILTRTFDSNTILESDFVPDDTPAFIKVGDYDFDLPANTTQIIKGYLVGELVWRIFTQNNRHLQGYIIVKLRKDNGTTETDIGEARTETLDLQASGSEYARSAIFMDISTGVRINNGDILRVTVELWGKEDDTQTGTPAGQRDIFFWFDPNATLVDTDKKSDFKIQIPFKVDK